MRTKYYYYYMPKVIFGTIFLLVALMGLAYTTLSMSDPVSKEICLVLFVLLCIFSFFLVKDGLVPALRNKAVLIADEKGITDIISWGLIEWSNIKELSPVKVRSMGSRNPYSFTEMRILLNNVNDYENYQNSWWIKLKIKWIRIYRGGLADIIIDIDALKGDANDVFNEINESYLYFTSKKQV